MKSYTDFVFDIDGTLLDTERTGVLSLMQTIRELTGREVSYDEAYHFFGIPSAKASATLGYSNKDRFAEVWEEHFQELMYMVTPFPGVEETLDVLKEKGVRTGVVTSRSQFELEYDPHLAKLLPRFDAVVCAADSVRHKPFPDPMLAYFAKTGAEAATTLYKIRESLQTIFSLMQKGCARSSVCRGAFFPCRKSTSCISSTALP